MTGYHILADLIVVVHFAFVVFVVVGLILILLGLALGWGWVRNVYFRILHLLAIGLVVVQAWLGITCPLTRWENELRVAAGQSAYTDTFIGRWVHLVLFFKAEPWVFTLIYSLFGLGVLASFVFGPPRLRRRGRSAGEPENRA